MVEFNGKAKLYDCQRTSYRSENVLYCAFRSFLVCESSFALGVKVASVND